MYAIYRLSFITPKLIYERIQYDTVLIVSQDFFEYIILNFSS